jgi:hypothetical protein
VAESESIEKRSYDLQVRNYRLQWLGTILIPLALFLATYCNNGIERGVEVARFRNVNQTSFESMKKGFDKLTEHPGERVVSQRLAYRILMLAYEESPNGAGVDLPALPAPGSAEKFGIQNAKIFEQWRDYGSDYAQGPYLVTKGWQRGEDIDNRDEMIEELARTLSLTVYFNLGKYDPIRKAWLPSSVQTQSERLQVQIRKPLDFNMYCDVILDAKTGTPDLLRLLERCGVAVTPFRWAWEKDSLDKRPDVKAWPSLTVSRDGVSNMAKELANRVNTKIYGSNFGPRFPLAK